MLDIAEGILNRLAEVLFEANWTVHDVFGSQEELYYTIQDD